jgi:hypothetical protein
MARYYIPKSSGTHADPMAAVGLADWLAQLDSPCQLRDEGGEYSVSMESSHDEIESELLLDGGYSYLRPNDKTPAPDWIRPELVFDYPRVKEQSERYRALTTAANRKGKKGVDLETAQADQPPPEWPLMQALNTLQGDGGTNSALEWIHSLDEADRDRTKSESLRALGSRRSPKVSLEPDLLQLFNPHAAKGYARLKPDSTGRGDKTKDAWADPFVEFLRYRGFFQGACTFNIGKDVRLLYPLPADIDFGLYSALVREVRQERYFGTASKVDCLATLAFTILVLRDGPVRRPAQQISGISITHYKSLGTGKAVTALERLAVPDWNLRLESKGDAERWIRILEEHRDRLRILRDDNSDQLDLIRAYRRFLETSGGQAARALLGFLGSYGQFIMRQRGANKWFHKQFTLANLEDVMQEFSAILENLGFRAVSAAIRSATVSAQSLKRNNRDHREIRYGLLAELQRKKLKKADLIAALSEFVTHFNAESARRLELQRQSGLKRVTTEEFAALVAVIEANDSALVGALLCAHATCRDVKDTEEPSVDTPDEENQS